MLLGHFRLIPGFGVISIVGTGVQHLSGHMPPIVACVIGGTRGGTGRDRDPTRVDNIAFSRQCDDVHAAFEGCGYDDVPMSS